MNSKIDIDYWVDEKATSAIRRFYPSVIAKQLSIPINEVVDRLSDMVKDGKLELLWEIVCPECYWTVAVTPEQDGWKNEDCECIEGHQFTITTDNIVPSFKITDYYREKASARKKKEHNRRLIPI